MKNQRVSSVIDNKTLIPTLGTKFQRKPALLTSHRPYWSCLLQFHNNLWRHDPKSSKTSKSWWWKIPKNVKKTSKQARCCCINKMVYFFCSCFFGRNIVIHKHLSSVMLMDFQKPSRAVGTSIHFDGIK